jgi:hypothetical protein
MRFLTETLPVIGKGSITPSLGGEDDEIIAGTSCSSGCSGIFLFRKARNERFNPKPFSLESPGNILSGNSIGYT